MLSTQILSFFNSLIILYPVLKNIFTFLKYFFIFVYVPNITEK
nr:MAG TPA: hypothetical protein [Caudoviricetes sp.]